MNELSPIPAPEDQVIDMIPRAVAEGYGIFPVNARDGVLSIVADATAQVALEDTVDMLQSFLGLTIQVTQNATRDQIQSAINQYYPPAAEYLTIDEIVQDLAEEEGTPAPAKGFFKRWGKWIGGGK